MTVRSYSPRWVNCYYLRRTDASSLRLCSHRSNVTGFGLRTGDSSRLAQLNGVNFGDSEAAHLDGGQPLQSAHSYRRSWFARAKPRKWSVNRFGECHLAVDRSDKDSSNRTGRPDNSSTAGSAKAGCCVGWTASVHGQRATNVAAALVVRWNTSSGTYPWIHDEAGNVDSEKWNKMQIFISRHLLIERFAAHC